MGGRSRTGPLTWGGAQYVLFEPNRTLRPHLELGHGGWLATMSPPRRGAHITTPCRRATETKRVADTLDETVPRTGTLLMTQPILTDSMDR